MVKEIGHFIGGQRVAGKSGRFADIYNPNTGEVSARAALASGAEVRAAVENAKAAQPEWAAKNPQVRARVMMRFLDLANQHREELARLISEEHGKTIPDALGDLQRGLEVAEFSARSLVLGQSLGELVPINDAQVEELRDRFLGKQ
jgi:malonate-semialdehyde dehydrogenase (acetylating)/methylmalonate-semialdehyde dehydrogenase